MELRDAFLKALDGGHDSVVVYEEIEGDLDTPVSILSKLLEHDSLFLLESAKEDKTYSRFSFLGFEPENIVVIKEKENLDFIKTLRVFETENLGDFKGGYVGYFAFESVELFDILRTPLKKKPDIYGLFFEVKKFLVYDNYTNRLYLGYHHLLDKNSSPEENIRIAQQSINEMRAALENLKNHINGDVSMPKIVSQMFSKEKFISHVKKVKGLIEEGEAIQVVLSNFYDVEGVDPFGFYRNLRRINPSPYMFYFKHKDFCMAGSSPEIHLKLRSNVATIRPIAGTKPKTENLEAVKSELLSDEKERAEHIMLVDLARNDLARISSPGAVTVTSFMKPEVYSHVVHLTSNVEADINGDMSVMDVISNTFPAGTLSGAPKVRAIEIIDDVETHPRGAYGGCVGYIDFSGNVDLAITIRTAIFNGDVARFQAGAGIVYDSNPESEYFETINKLKALLKAGGIDDSFN